MTAADAIAALLNLATSGKDRCWPLKSDEPILKAINTYVAIRENDAETVAKVAGYKGAQVKPYRVDALGDRIADAWAHYLFGEDAAVTAKTPSNQTLYDDLVADDFASELERAAGLCVSEGEIWSRVYVDAQVAPRPLLEWVSRSNVLPLWVGPSLKAAAIITELPAYGNDTKVVWRHFECHSQGMMLNVLFAGKDSNLGDIVNLDAHPSTIGLDEQWDHGLEYMLVERVPNRLRKNRKFGVSDYKGILDELLDLNELALIGSHNMRLTARKRAVISRALANEQTRRNDLTLTPEEGGATAMPRPTFDPSEEVFVAEPLDVELGAGNTTDPYRIIEYSFDAAALISWRRDLVETAVTRVGLSAQYAGLGTGDDGYALSGTALRLRLIPTDKTGRGKARYWNDALPRILTSMAAVDSLPVANNGYQRAWTNPIDCTVTRKPGLPVDDLEEAQRHAALLGAGAESIKNAVTELHPDWTVEQVAAEVAEIRADKASTMPAFGAV